MSVNKTIAIRVIQILCIRGIRLITTTEGNLWSKAIISHTYQRKGNHELWIQALNIIVADLQNQMNNLTGGDPGSGDPDGVGTTYSFYF